MALTEVQKRNAAALAAQGDDVAAIARLVAADPAEVRKALAGRAPRSSISKDEARQNVAEIASAFSGDAGKAEQSTEQPAE